MSGEVCSLALLEPWRDEVNVYNLDGVLLGKAITTRVEYGYNHVGLTLRFELDDIAGMKEVSDE